MDKKILIIGTVPYNKKSTSRAFESYFSSMKKENLAQIFSNTKKPCKGHCQTLFQITDKMLVERWIKGKKYDVGKIYYYDNLDDEWKDNSLEIGKSSLLKKMYKLGAKHTPVTHLLRKILWKKKMWCTEKLNKWLDEFNPDCVFLSFSDDFFIPEIALYVSKKYNIPIVSSIGDDYYFNMHFSLSPFYYIYKLKYRKLIKKILSYSGYSIYIGDKIKNKYNKEFNMNGKTVYLTSEIERKPFKIINTTNPLICYFGNIRMGRNESLIDIAKVLYNINPNYIINVYSNENDNKYINKFNKYPNIKYCGSVPYSKVKELTIESDIILLVEGFKKKDIDQSRYSLSTKSADSIASGCNTIVYGSIECGLVEYMQQTKCSCVCTNKNELENKIKDFINNVNIQKKYYDTAILVQKENHILENSNKIFENVVENSIEEFNHGIK